jgi:AraC family transcriptional regulator, positive regulator of tynA and feaB
MFSAYSVTRSEPGRPCWADIVSAKLGTTRVEAVRGEGGFFGQLSLFNLGYLRLAHVRLRGAAVRGMRRRTNIGRQSFSWLAASLNGGFELCYSGRSAVLEPGRIAILDPRRTYVTTFAQNSEVLWVRVPHAFLEPHLAGAAQVIIDGGSGAGRIAFDTLRSLLGQAGSLHPGEGRPVADGLVSMLEAAGVGAHGHRKGGTAAGDSTLQRVKAFVLDNLSDDSLCAHSIAVANGVTSRYINRLFEREGMSLMRWVWQQRLENARRVLAHTRETHAVGGVAYAYGFKSASHFSHAFRRQFGHAPSSTSQDTADE